VPSEVNDSCCYRPKVAFRTESRCSDYRIWFPNHLSKAACAAGLRETCAGGYRYDKCRSAGQLLCRRCAATAASADALLDYTGLLDKFGIGCKQHVACVAQRFPRRSNVPHARIGLVFGVSTCETKQLG